MTRDYATVGSVKLMIEESLLRIRGHKAESNRSTVDLA
jgi:hypothetical protein